MSRRSSTPRWRGAELIGILLVLFGLLFLLRNAGVVRLEWGALGALFIVGLGLVLLVGALLPRGGGVSATSVPRDGTARLDLDLGVGAGTFRIGGGARELVEVRSQEDDVATSVERGAGTTRVRIRQRADWFPFGWHGAYAWEVALAEDVPIAFVLAAGAGDFTIDLAPLRIVDARISAGAAQVRLTLPRPSGEVRVNVSAGAASVAIRVPPGVEAKITTSGLMSIEGRNETPGFATASDRVLVSVSGGASSLKIV